MASLGSLSFSILYKDNPEELEKIKKRALEQLKDIEVKVNMSGSKTGVSKQAKETAKMSSEQIGYIEQLIQRTKDLEQQYKKLPEAADATPIIQEFSQIKRQLDDVGNNLVNASKKQDLAEGSILSYRAQLSKLIYEYDRLSQAEREAAAGKGLLENIQRTTVELKNAEEASMRYQRNVGNYKSAFNGLSFQVQQLARELPSIAYGANIFFAAISNNLPMFTDEVKKAGEEYKKLKAEQAAGMNLNQKAIPVWKQLMSSIFSWQTAIVAVVTILTLYGGKLVDTISKLFKFRDATELTRKEIKKLGEDFAEAAGSEIAKLDVLFNNLEKTRRGTKEWYDARAQILTQHGDTLNAMNTEISTLEDKAGAYRVLRDEIYETAKAEAISKGTREAQNKATQTAIEGYSKIYEEAVSKFGKGYADSFIDRLRNDMEVAGKLSDDLAREISDKFTYTGAGGGKQIGGSITGYVAQGSSEVNDVLNAIRDIARMQDELTSKRNAAEGAFSWLNISEKGIKQNKGYWETQKKSFQDRLDSLTMEQAKGKEGLKLKQQIAEIDKAISSYETKSGKSSGSNDPLKDRVSLLTEANSLYKEWVKIVGVDGAKSVVNAIYPDFNPDALRSELEKIKKSGSKDAKVEAAKALTGLDRESIDTTLKDAEKQITDTVAKWNLFSKLMKESGDVNFSMNAAFGGNIGFKSVLEQLQGEIENEIKGNKFGITFSDLIKGGSADMFGGKVSSLVEAYRDESKKLSDESLLRAAELLNNYKNYEQQRKDITVQGEKDIADLIANGASREAIDEANKRMSESLASLDFKEFKDSDMWASVFEDVDRLSTDAIDSAIAKLEEFSNTAGRDLPINEFKELMNALKKLRGESESRNPFKSLAEGIREYSKASGSDLKSAAIDKIKDAFSNATPYLQSFGSAFGELGSMFDALGNEGMSNAMGYAEMAIGTVTNIGEGFAKGGIVGGIAAAAGEAAKWIGKLAGDHDAKLDKAIQKSQMEVQKLQGLYEGIERSIERSLGNVSNLNRRQKQLLEQQRRELEKQKKAEESKKKSDESKVADYKNQINEINDQIRYFAEDLANDLLGIDLKGWASQLGDALFDAWKKGEDGAEAFKKKSAELLGNVMNDILKIGILEPMMEDVRKALFGTDNRSGFFGYDYILDQQEMSQLADILMKGEKKSEAYYEALEGLNDYMSKNYGVSLKEKDSRGGLSAGIKGIKEDQADILASIVNAMRADGAKITEAVLRYVNDLAPEMSAMVKAQLAYLLSISNNTKRNADMAEEIRDLFSAVVSGTKQVKVK